MEPMENGQNGRPVASYKLVETYGPDAVTRREFLKSWTGIAWLTFTGASVAQGLVYFRYMYPRALEEPPLQFKAGKPDDFEWDVPSENFKQKYGTWIVKLSKDAIRGRKALVALSTVCTHLGCTPNVLIAEQKIKCPCHGSGFRFNGINFEGPAPRPLERYKIWLDPIDGQIVVDKNKKFQFEKGEWEDPDSFIDLSTLA